MAIKNYKPTSAGRRHGSVLRFSEEITRTKPEESLLRPQSKSGGRNNHGHQTCRNIGGGSKRMYRVVDFKRSKDAIPAKVVSIEYDPNRSANIALVHYADGAKAYVLAPVGLQVGQTLMNGEKADPNVGNCLPLGLIPVGLEIHNIEIHEGRGGQMCRTAGTAAQLTAKEGDWAVILMPSGEVRRVHIRCRATIGRIGNLDWQNVSIGKAGRHRHMGRRPHVRGTTMNPVDHPLGGGEGRTKGGRHPCNFKGLKAKGLKTRKKNHPTDRFIVRSRHKV
ncbi:MAG: 50S ribosomal protein L2 [Planctomycetaceae bacterium]|jgi:large subunit ribosomal protein L2|nr:50S ribosomal protein L2 [Planctomycetaceae bacterium]